MIDWGRYQRRWSVDAVRVTDSNLAELAVFINDTFCVCVIERGALLMWPEWTDQRVWAKPGDWIVELEKDEIDGFNVMDDARFRGKYVEKT